MLPSGGYAADGGKDRVASLTAILQSNAEQKEKADACRELARIGNREAVAALAGLLGDERLSHMARYGLETIPDPAVDQAFRAALEKVQGLQLAGVIGSIGVRRDVNAVSPVSKLLAGSDANVVQAAARTLGKIGTPAAAKALQLAFPKVDPRSQLAVYEGLFRCAEKFQTQGKNKAAAAVYDWARQQRPALHQVRTAALRGAILSRSAAGLPILIEALRQTDYPTFASAARISHEVSGEAVTRALTDELAKNSGDKAILLLETLGKRRDTVALPALFQAAAKAEKPVRLVALHMISEFGDSSAVPVYVALLEDSDTDIAQAAQEGLVYLPGKDADDVILNLVKASETKRRSLGLELVSRRRMTTALPEVLSVARGQDSALHAVAIRRFGELSGARELPTLIELLNEAQTPAELEAAEQALGGVVARAAKPQECADALAASFAGAKPGQKCTLVRVIGSVGGGSGLRAMRVAVKDPAAEVRTTAIRTMGAWNNADAAGDLLEMARTCAEPAEKTLALRSYLALAHQNEIPAENRLAICREAATLVQQEDEKKSLLGALGGIPSIDSVNLLEAYFGDAGTKGEAAAACVEIADKLLKSKEANTTAARLVEPLQKAVEAGASDELSRRAQALLDEARKKASESK